LKLCEQCDNHFTPKVSYQIYCSVECRDSATKNKIAERYQATRRQRRIGKTRKCRNCKESLSIYADGPLCNFCIIDPNLVSKALKELKKLGILDYEQE